MRQYQVEASEGIKSVSHIGVNYHGEEEIDLLSSYDRSFDNGNEIVIIDGENTYNCTIGDILDAYNLMRSYIASRNLRDAFEYIECIQNVILAYFGNSYSVTSRIRSLNNHRNNYKVSDLAHENSAIGIERAMLAQNLLWEVDVNSVYKIGIVILNNKPTIHAYNIITFEGKHYIFDSMMPTVNNGLISPIICEISDEVYEKMISPIDSLGVNLEVNHVNPLKNQDINIIYDASSKIIKEKEKTKTKRGVYESIE